MTSRTSTLLATLGAIALQAGFTTTAYAQSAAVFYDAQTELKVGNIGSQTTEGMAWGYFHTGTLTQDLTISVGDPVAIQLIDQDWDEQYVGGADDELQLWLSDTALTATAGQSVRFEFFAVVPADLRAAASEQYEDTLEVTARVSEAPTAFASAWSNVTWTSSARTFEDRAASFEGYPAADHVVRLYYVQAGQGIPAFTTGGNQLQSIVQSGNKHIVGTAFVNQKTLASSTNENIWNTTAFKGVTGSIVVENTSDREDLVVNLDFLKLWDEDDTSADDEIVSVTSRAPTNFNLGPGGTIGWVISGTPTWESIEDARDFFPLTEGDLDLYITFSVNGDPVLPHSVVSDEEFEALLSDQAPSTFRFGASDSNSALPPPPIVTFSGAASSYTVDQDVNIACTVTDGGGGIAFDTCSDISAPAWSFPAGTSTYSAYAVDLFGQEGSDSVSFDVVVTPASLIAITQRFVDHNGVENSLVTKIRQAGAARTPTAQDAACNAFIHEVEAQAGNHVSEFYAEVLIYWAEVLRLQ